MTASRSLIRRVLKWFGILLLVAVILVVAAVAYVYFSSENIINRTFAIPGTSVVVPTDSTSIAEGRRLATIRGCFGGCHGANAEGEVFMDEPPIARIVAPNLTRVVHDRSTEELDRIVRHGVLADGRSTLAMPSSSFYLLSDTDLGRILAFLQSLPELEGPQTDVTIGPVGRLGLTLGQFKPQAGVIDHEAPRPDVQISDSVAYGRYLALTVCSECHGMDLGGGDDGSAPDLLIATAYSETDFFRFMRTGEALGGRELELMSEVARRRFSHFTDAELGALFGFLKRRAYEGETVSGG